MKASLDRYRALGRVNWPTTLFLLITPIAGLAGGAWWLASGRFHWGTIALFFAAWAVTAMGITGGYHRLFSHRAYQASAPLRAAFLLAGGAAWEGSCLEWCRDHRRHHRYVDGKQDPYNINEGFWWAHVLWLVFDRREPLDPAEVPDLHADPLMRFQHRWYGWTATVTSFFVPIGLAALWGDPWGGLFVAGCLRIVLNHHATFLINSLSHVAGTQPYSDSHSARDNWFTAFLTYGEGYHNYHHEFPSDYRNGVRFYQWDPTKWLIWTCRRLGLASGLRRVDAERVLSRRLAMSEKRLAARLAHAPGTVAETAEHALAQIRERFHAVAGGMTDLRRQYQSAARELRARWDEATARRLKELTRRLKEAERELRATLTLWQSAARGVNRLAATA